MRKDNTLLKIDNYFENKKSSEVSIIISGIFLIVCYFTYILSFDPAQQFYENTMLENNKVSTNLNETKNYLASVTVNGDLDFKIKEQQAKLSNLQSGLESAKFTNQYFDKKLKELSYLLFNEQNWANFLDSLAYLADQNGVKIVKIANEFKNPTPQKIEQVIDIKLDIQGSFKNIVGYINSIEESELVVDINHIDINSTKKDLVGNLGIFVWGMKY